MVELVWSFARKALLTNVTVPNKGAPDEIKNDQGRLLLHYAGIMFSEILTGMTSTSLLMIYSSPSAKANCGKITNSFSLHFNTP